LSSFCISPEQGWGDEHRRHAEGPGDRLRTRARALIMLILHSILRSRSLQADSDLVCTSFCLSRRFEGWQEIGELHLRSISPSLQTSFIAHLKEEMVPGNTHPFYVKWLSYYLDFCEKYRCPPEQRTSLREFLLELKAKNQSSVQQQEASHAISLYYELLQPQVAVGVTCSPQQTISSFNSTAGSSPSVGLSSEPALPPWELNLILLT
jgi:hypothetical protein